MKVLFTVICIAAGLTFALHHAERRTEREKVRSLADEEAKEVLRIAEWKRWQAKALKDAEADQASIKRHEDEAREEHHSRIAAKERTDFTIPSSGYATYEDAALWAVTLFPDAEIEGSALWTKMKNYHDTMIVPGSARDIHPFKALRIARWAASELGIAPAPNVSIPELGRTFVEMSCFATLRRLYGSDYENGRVADWVAHGKTLLAAHDTSLSMGDWPLYARDLVLSSINAQIAASITPRAAYNPRSNPTSDANLASQGVNPRFWSNRPASKPSAPPAPIPQDLEIEERGNFWFGSDGSSGHIRVRPGGGKVYER